MNKSVIPLDQSQLTHAPLFLDSDNFSVKEIRNQSIFREQPPLSSEYYHARPTQPPPTPTPCIYKYSEPPQPFIHSASNQNPFLYQSHGISSIPFHKEMEFSAFHPSSWNSLLTSTLLHPYHFIPENYVHWTETPESHIYSADLPGVRKEEIKVEVENSRYLIIRTEGVSESTEPAKNFMRKFRLPERVDINGISADYENGVLTVSVPRSFVRRALFINPAELQERMGVSARAA